MLRCLAWCAGSPLLLASLAAGAQSPTPVAKVQYACAGGKTLAAEYFDGPTGTAPSGMPLPGGKVVLTLADGKRLELPQTLSGSGIRYASADGGFVFWSKGDTAFVEEGPSQTQTYTNCVAKKN